jgi:hypothetical protein
MSSMRTFIFVADVTCLTKCPEAKKEKEIK